MKEMKLYSLGKGIIGLAHSSNYSYLFVDDRFVAVFCPEREHWPDRIYYNFGFNLTGQRETRALNKFAKSWRVEKENVTKITLASLKEFIPDGSHGPDCIA